ncbi:MAG: hypothetical protein AAF492_25200, partial [Verrucomicrobiota bacterium]
MKPWLVLLGLGLTITDAESREPPTTLTDFQDIFQAQLKGIEDESRTMKKKPGDAYMKSLRSMEENFRKDGQLENVIMVRREIDRFSETSDFPDGSSSETIGRLQNRFHEQFLEIDYRQAVKIQTLAKKYEEGLKRLMKLKVQQEELNEAIAIQDELHEIGSTPQVATASETVAAWKERQTLKTSSGGRVAGTVQRGNVALAKNGAI